MRAVVPSPSPGPSSFRRLADHCERLTLPHAAIFAKQMADDLERHSATVLVCGEFKRGKSSLVNALVGHPDLLPVDIRPTTAVTHLIRHGDPALIIHLRSGASERLPLTPESLLQLASDEAGGSRDPEQIEFAELTMPGEFLESGMVLVDTPGTNDLCQTRAEIVYRMIPRADAVLFVLDATTQLTRTEIAFLSDRMLKSLAPPLCFVLNKLDRVDAEERDEVIAATRATVAEHLPGVDLRLVGSSTSDPAIGVGAVREFLAGFLAGGERHAAAGRKHLRMFEALKKLVLDAIAERERLGSMQAGQLQTALDQARQQRTTLDARVTDFQAYLRSNGPEQLLPMIRRSFTHHLEDLERFLLVQARSGGNPAVYAQTQLPLAIETGIKQWLDRKLPEIGQFTTRYQQAMLHEYHRCFGDEAVRRLRVDMAVGIGEVSNRIDQSGIVIEDPDDRKGLLMRAGLPVAGALLAMTALSGGAALIIGGALGGIVAQHLAKQRAEVARDTLASQIPGVLRDHGGRFIAQVVGEIERFLDHFAQRLATLAHDEANRHEQRISEALALAENHEVDHAKQQAEWSGLRKEVEMLTVPIA